ncbi:hypothetical protein [Yeosuana sp. AK3]
MVKVNSVLWYISLFLLVLYFFEFVYYKDVYLVITDETDKFNLKNFTLFNFCFKLIGYLFKIVFLFGFFKFVLLAFNINEEVSIVKSILILEIISLLLVKGSLILYFFFIDNKMDLQFLMGYETSASLKIFFTDTIANSSIKPLLSSITIFDIFYVIFLVLLFSNDLKRSFINTFKIIGISYLVLLLFFGVIKTFISL